MSLENHPNFHAVKFTTSIIEAYFESLRGKAKKELPEGMHDLLIKFVADVEELVDATAAAPKKNVSRA